MTQVWENETVKFGHFYLKYAGLFEFSFWNA